MLQRSIWSGLVLSAAVTAAGLLGHDAQAQETPATAAAPATTDAAAPATASAPAASAAPAAPAVDAKLVSQADDFLHFSLINNTELAKANGEALLASGASPEDLLRAFEEADRQRGYRDIMKQDQRRAELKDVATKLLDKVEEGFRAVARDPQRLRRELDNLASGPRP